MTSEDEVRKASERFYTAINCMLNGDARPMADIWSHSPAVAAMHPIGGRQVGWDQVRESWEQTAKMASGGQAQLHDQLIQVAGDVAYEVGTEQGQGKLGGEQVVFKQRVTNIYRRENGEWKVVLHHTDVSPAMMDLLSRLQPPKGK